MKPFFELLEKRIAFSRSGRINIGKKSKKFISTPNIVIPIKNILMNQLDFIKDVENHDIFLISSEKYLKEDIIQDKFRNKGFVYAHLGTLEKFQEILNKEMNLFSENNIISIIPFNIPTTSISKDFATKEIEYYLNSANRILINNPNLNFGLSVKIFDYHDLTNLYIPTIKNNDNVKILVLSDVFDNTLNYRNIIKTLLQIKRDLDNNLILFASGKIIPKFYPMLVYLGIDLIDSSYLLYLSSENFYDTIENLLPIYKIKYLPCSCVVCRSKLKNLLEDKYSAEKTKLLCLHNLITAENYLNKIKQYLNYEDFRAFVEKSSLDDTTLISMLKILDKECFKILRYETPIVQENKIIKCLGASSYYRPDFQEFRERVVKYFSPEPSTTLILILPCSSKKPYSESKSHRQFYKVIRKFPEFPNFQEIILTSPLGAIPRQLENIYPVNSYDISVTGDWNNEEIKIAAEMLVQILKKYDNNIPIICHLEGGYSEIVKKAQEKLQHDFYFSEIHQRTTSVDSLNSLENLISNYKDKFSPKNEIKNGDYFLKTWIRKFVKILDYQFGLGSGMRILSNGLILRRNKKGNKTQLIDPKTKELLGIFKRTSGQIALTIKGALRIAPFSDSNVIIFNGTKIIGNTLFRPGINDYSLNLLPSNFVIILDNEKKNIIGLGQLIVGSNYLKNSKTGRIAKIYESK
ncbi:MAG: hypothetical protein EU540_06280 [Promethearchaeota archaeon]|nr:MAG: hypothetical protein EU540_06280 [Candidatus Lokiarchaeota archaeon]